MENVKMPNKWLALTFLALSVSLIVVDGTIVNVAIPVIMRDLHLNFTQVEWVNTLYALVFSALLITTGRIADDIGRKKTLIIGIVVFVIGSITASLSKDINFLLLARFIQGIGGAIVLPTTLSTVNSVFFGKDRAIAFAVWGSVIAGMAAIGPLLGGYFTTYMTWEWIFWINVPIGVIIIVGSLIYVPETFGEKMEVGFDFVGFVLSIVGMASVVYALIEGHNHGWWHPAEGTKVFLMNLSIIPWLLGLGLISLILFVLWERHVVLKGRAHLLDVTLFRLRSFSLGNLIACLVAIGEFGLLFVLPIFMQNILGFSPMKAGWILAAMGIGAFVSGGLASEIGRRTSPARVATIGLFFESLGLIGFFLMIKPGTATSLIVFWLVVYGFGLGMASAQLTSTVLVDVTPEKSGQGSATQSTVRQLGSALGVAIVGTVLATFLTTAVPKALENNPIPEPVKVGIQKSVIQTAGSSIGSLKSSNQLAMFPEPMKKELFNDLDKSFTDCAVKTIGVSALILFTGFVLTLFLPNTKHKKANETN